MATATNATRKMATIAKMRCAKGGSTVLTFLALAVAIATAGTPALAAPTCLPHPPWDCPEPKADDDAEDETDEDETDETETER